MGKFRIEVMPMAKIELEKHYKAGNKVTINKIEQIFLELENDPHVGTGKPERLKHDLKGYWSRRLNQKDRLIYTILDQKVTVIVVSAMGHYFDK